MNGTYRANFKSPKRYFYEARETLRAAAKAGTNKRLEEIARDMLRRYEIIGIPLFEAAACTANLPISDRKLRCH